MINLSASTETLISQILVFLGITAFNILFAAALYYRWKQGFIKKTQNSVYPNSHKVTKVNRVGVRNIEGMSQSFHDSALAIVTMIAPWLVPVVNAYLIGHAVRTLLDWPVMISILTGIAVEMVGIQTVTLTLKIFDYELVRGKKSTSSVLSAKTRGDISLQYHLWIGLALSLVYFAVLVFMTYVLKIYPDSAQYASLGMIGLTVASVISIALKSSAQAAFDERILRLEEVAEDKRIADEEKARISEDKRIADAEKAERERIENEQEQMQLQRIFANENALPIANANALPTANANGAGTAMGVNGVANENALPIAMGVNGAANRNGAGMQNSRLHSTEDVAIRNFATISANGNGHMQNGNSHSQNGNGSQAKNGANANNAELQSVTLSKKSYTDAELQNVSLSEKRYTDAELQSVGLSQSGYANATTENAVRTGPKVAYAKLKANQKKLVDVARHTR